MINLGKAIVPVLAGLRGLAALSGVGLTLVAASVAATTATFLALNKQIDETIKGLSEAVDKNISLKNTARELAILNRKYKETFDNSIIILREFEHELSVKIPNATEKAINKFDELNRGALSNIQDKFKNMHMIIAEGINDAITKTSQALARSIVFGEKLTDTLKNLAINVFARILAALIEQIARQSVLIFMNNTVIGQKLKQLAIEKDILNTQKKQNKQNFISTFTNVASSFLPFMANGGAVSKGKPVVVGERGAEVFVPNSSGQITQAARGTGGSAVNVNFTINTIDSRGFDQALVENRGTITSIINNALAEKGRGELI